MPRQEELKIWKKENIKVEKNGNDRGKASNYKRNEEGRNFALASQKGKLHYADVANFAVGRGGVKSKGVGKIQWKFFPFVPPTKC